MEMIVVGHTHFPPSLVMGGDNLLLEVLAAASDKPAGSTLTGINCTMTLSTALSWSTVALDVAVEAAQQNVRLAMITLWLGCLPQPPRKQLHQQ